MWFRVGFSWALPLYITCVLTFTFLPILVSSSVSSELSDELINIVNNRELTKQICLNSSGEIVREEGNLVAQIVCIGSTPMELDGAIINISGNKIHESLRFTPKNIEFFLKKLISGKFEFEYRSIEIQEFCKMDRSNANGCAHAFELQDIKIVGYKIWGVIWPDKTTSYAYNVYLGITVDF